MQCCTAPQDPKSSPSTWEMILKAEDFRRRSFGDLDKNKDGYVDAAVRHTCRASCFFYEHQLHYVLLLVVGVVT